MLKDYSTCLTQRNGNKVSWRYYATEQEAQNDASIAVYNAKYLMSVGYSFGYNFPGSVEEAADGTWQLCVP